MMHNLMYNVTKHSDEFLSLNPFKTKLIYVTCHRIMTSDSDLPKNIIQHCKFNA